MVVVVLSLAAYQYADLMDAEVKAAERIRKTTEARAFAESGVHVAMAYIADPDAFEGKLNKNPFDNPAAFQAVIVRQSDAPGNQGRFSLVSLDYSDTAGLTSAKVRFGLTDEAAKLNINALIALDSSGRVLHDALMKLPNMTDEIAWSIVDWIDADEDENPGGCREPVLRLPQPAVPVQERPARHGRGTAVRPGRHPGPAVRQRPQPERQARPGRGRRVRRVQPRVGRAT